jgi:hypothetical protein
MFDEEFVYPWQNSNNFEWNDQWKTKAVRAHPSSPGNDHRNDYLLTGIKSIFNEVPRDLDKFIIASQIVQAEAMKYFVEFWVNAMKTSLLSNNLGIAFSDVEIIDPDDNGIYYLDPTIVESIIRGSINSN